MGFFRKIMNTTIDVYRVQSTGTFSSDVDDFGAPAQMGVQNPYELVIQGWPARIEGAEATRTIMTDIGLVDTGSGGVSDFCFTLPFPSGRDLKVGYIIIDNENGQGYIVKDPPNKSPGGSTSHHWELGLQRTEVLS